MVERGLALLGLLLKMGLDNVELDVRPAALRLERGERESILERPGNLSRAQGSSASALDLAGLWRARETRGKTRPASRAYPQGLIRRGSSTARWCRRGLGTLGARVDGGETRGTSGGLSRWDASDGGTGSGTDLGELGAPEDSVDEGSVWRGRVRVSALEARG